jgi:pyruvate carboxylase
LDRSPILFASAIASDEMLPRGLATAFKIKIAPGKSMTKALNGGAGRGVRVVSRAEDVDEASKRCLREIPSF